MQVVCELAGQSPEETHEPPYVGETVLESVVVLDDVDKATVVNDVVVVEAVTEASPRGASSHRSKNKICFVFKFPKLSTNNLGTTMF